MYHPNCKQVAAADFVVAVAAVAAQQVFAYRVYAAAVSDNEVSDEMVYAAAVSDSDSASGDNVAADVNGDGDNA